MEGEQTIPGRSGQSGDLRTIRLTSRENRRVELAKSGRVELVMRGPAELMIERIASAHKGRTRGEQTSCHRSTTHQIKKDSQVI